MPGPVKVCSFNCLYCQYGWTKVAKPGEGGAGPVPGIDDVARAVESALAALPSPPAYITFSGNGEPSLHPAFADIVRAVAHVRDRLAPAARTAILSNSSTAGDDQIRRSLAALDVRIMKLDCGREGTFRRFNGPGPDLSLDAVTEGLTELSRLAPTWIQSLWAGGSVGNFGPMTSGDDLSRHPEVSAWIRRLRRIRPAFVQVYSLDRDTPVKDLRRLEKVELDPITAEIRRLGFQAESFSRAESG
jgi:wyosine [tRNA(Phe)-imidazoG37] synthetase (radical SAM superfamily)